MRTPRPPHGKGKHVHSRWLLLTGALGFIFLFLAPCLPAETVSTGDQQAAILPANDRATQLADAFPGWSISSSGMHGRIVEIWGKSLPIAGVSQISSIDLSQVAVRVLEALRTPLDLSGLDLRALPAAAFGAKTIFQYRQYFKGVRVEAGGLVAIVSQDGEIVYISKDCVSGLDLNTIPSFSADQAIERLPIDISSGLSDASPVSSELVIITTSSEQVRLAYKLRCMTIAPPAGWLIFMDAISGELISRSNETVFAGGSEGGYVPASLSPQEPDSLGPPDTSHAVNIYIRVLTGWELLDHSVARGGASGSAITLEQLDIAPPALQGVDAKRMIRFYANDTGYYHYTQPIACDSFRVIYFISNDISRVLTYTGQQYKEFQDTSAFEHVNSNCGTTSGFYFDWYTSHLITANPAYVGELNVAHYERGMRDWYRSWLGDDFHFQRITTRTRYGSGDYYTGEIFLDNAGVRDPKIICHEFAHAVATYSLNALGFTYATWMNEGQAQYFSPSFVGSEPFSYGFDDLFRDDATNPQLQDLEVHHYGNVLTLAWWDLRNILGNAQTDSMAFYSMRIQSKSLAEAMRACLIYDDDNDDLSDGTPHFADIVSVFSDRWIGPDVPTVFLVNIGDVLAYGPLRRVSNAFVDMPFRFATLDTYPMDSLVWDFGDDSSTVVQVNRSTTVDSLQHNGFPYISHRFTECGDFNVVCRSYHAWGVRADTLIVRARVPGQDCPYYLCGDANTDFLVDSLDVFYISDYIFEGGPAPVPYASGDVNCDSLVDVSDLVRLTAYVYSHNVNLQCCGGVLPKTRGVPSMAEVARGAELIRRFDADVPRTFALDQNRPNPFNPTTTISYALPQRSQVSLRVYNILGQLVRTLVDEREEIGFHEAIWDGTDDAGSQVASGVYVYRLSAGDYLQTKKMLLMK